MSLDDEFLGRVGHDLRGELATMVAGVHYLLRYETQISGTAREMLERVNGAGQRLAKLLNEFEHASWIEGRDASSLLTEPGRPSAIVEGALLRLERVIAARSIQVDARVPGDLPELEGDPELLGAAFEYVLDFALARSARAAVHVAGERVDGASVITITDEGGAIPPAALARLLEPFVEKEALPPPEPGARRRERLGLGLAIAHGIFAAHGGGLRASIAPDGRGIELTCTLGRPASALRQSA
jgi:two-component system OmpR family sensor kinase